MKRLASLAAVAFALFAASCSSGPDLSDGLEQINEGIRCVPILMTLSDDSMMGRAPATPGEQNGC